MAEGHYRVKRPGKFLPLDRVVVMNDYPFHLELRNQTVIVKQIWDDGDVACEFETRHYTINKRWLFHSDDRSYEDPPETTSGQRDSGDECQCRFCRGD